MEHSGTRDCQIPLDVPEALRTPVAKLFGERSATVQRYAYLLSTTGVQRGLLGPGEAPRIWERHILNCGVIAPHVSTAKHLLDVGSGAGLPGIVLAIARQDLKVTLIESQLRRANFLAEVVTDLGLENVEICRSRAEDCAKKLAGDVVTARAVAPLGRLVDWCLPLVCSGGRLLAIKGESAQIELHAARQTLRKHKISQARILQCGAEYLNPPVTVIEVTKAP